ncbi:hypothetical protein F5141DRAFT_1213337 [Pisolithus sp. B1]|nr:hypothetical protein F5141DRAFT_1213337 [Pisolithus sp. B1]
MADAQKINMELPATYQEINHHITSTEAQSTIPTSLVRPQTSVTTVPGTPGVDSGSSSFILPSISSEQVTSRCKLGSNTVHAQGMPLAVGIIHGWRANAIHSSLITPSHAHPSGLSSALLKSSVLKTTVPQEDDDAQHAPTSISDADQDGSKQEEAWCLLEVAQAQCLVHSIEWELAKVKLRENIVLGMDPHGLTDNMLNFMQQLLMMVSQQVATTIIANLPQQQGHQQQQVDPTKWGIADLGQFNGSILKFEEWWSKMHAFMAITGFRTHCEDALAIWSHMTGLITRAYVRAQIDTCLTAQAWPTFTEVKMEVERRFCPLHNAD